MNQICTMTMWNNYIFWDVVLVNFPFVEGIGNKIRPALILKKEWVSYFLVGITSNTSGKQEYDFFVPKNDQNNLSADSIVKINKLGFFFEKFLIKKIGVFSDQEKKEVKELLIKYFSDL